MSLLVRIIIPDTPKLLGLMSNSLIRLVMKDGVKHLIEVHVWCFNILLNTSEEVIKEILVALVDI